MKKVTHTIFRHGIFLLLLLQIITGRTYSQDTTRIISGIVTDEKNAPLSGATVRATSSGKATTTDNAGKFRISASSNEQAIVVSFVGYVSKTIQLAANTTDLSVALANDAVSMSDVVVIGYGTRKKADVTGAVASVNLEAQRDAPNVNIGQFLQGTVPGLNVGQVNAAGSTPSISIRGRVSISGNQNVLIILDGVQYNNSLSSINPDDIASIDVLKDASSTAVYGAQAANGVILITSRKGKNNQKPRIAFSSSYTTQRPTANLRPLNKEEYLENIRQMYWDRAYLGPDYTTPNPAFDIASVVDASMKDASGALLDNNYNWWNEGTRQGFINDNQLSISGGADKINYLISGSFLNQAGIIVNDKFKRKSIRANIEAQPLNWLKAGIQSFGSFVNMDGAEPTLADLQRQSPLLVPYDANGALIPNPFNTLDVNPFLSYDVDDYERHNYYFLNVYSEVKLPVKGLTYRLTFGNNYRTDQNFRASKYGAGLTGSAYKNNEHYYDYTFDNILSYSKEFGKHNIDATLLYGAINRKDEYTSATANNFSRLTLGFDNLGLGATQFANSSAYSEALQYQMARVNYKFNDRYLLTGTIRRDGFSGFASNNKYAYFPVLAVGWIASEESFLQKDWIDFLKLRVGYGLSGNQTSRYNSLSVISSGAAYIFGEGGTTQFGQQVNSLENPDLKWEKTAGLNAGVDFTLFHGKLQGTIDAYQNTTRDLLFSVAIPNITGFSSINTNVGKIENRGIEISLTGNVINQGDFRWTVTANYAMNNNKIQSLTGVDADGDGKEDDLVSSNLFIGKSISAIYDYQVDGIYQVADQKPAGFYTGTYRVVDRDKSGAITAADRTFLGKQDPLYRASLLNRFEYKGFSLMVFLNAVQGGSNSYLGANAATSLRNDNAVRWNTLSGIDFWSPANPNGEYPRYITSPLVVPTVYRNRSFVRLQDVSLSYNFSDLLTKKTTAQNISLFVSGKNLATWTKWKGWDPETGQGYSIGGRPVMKSYAVGFNVTF